MAKKRVPTRGEQRSLRLQRLVFIVISVMIVLTMVLSLVSYQ